MNVLAKIRSPPGHSAFARPVKTRNQDLNLKRVSRMLRMAGLSYSDIDQADKLGLHSWKLHLYHCYSLVVFIVVSLLSIFQLLSVFAFWGDFQVVTINMCIFLMTVDKPIIMYLFIQKRESILVLIDELKKVCNKAGKLATTKHKLEKKPNCAKCVVRLAVIGSMLTVLSWMLYPIVFNTNNRDATFIFTTWYPIDTSRSMLRPIRLSFEIVGIACQGTVGGSAYSLLYTLTDRWCQSMQLLSTFTDSIGVPLETGSTSDDDDEEEEEDACVLVRMGWVPGGKNDEKSNNEVRRVIENIGLRGGEIIASAVARGYDDKVIASKEMPTESLVVISISLLEIMIRWLHNFQKIFNPLLFILYKTCRYVLSITAFQVALITDWNDPMLFKLSITMVTAVIRLFFVCFIGEKMIKKTEELCSAAYNCKWTSCDKRTKFGVVMLLMRSNLPRQLLSGNTRLSLATFLTSIHDSYTFYNMLRQFNDLF